MAKTTKEKILRKAEKVDWVTVTCVIRIPLLLLLREQINNVNFIGMIQSVTRGEVRKCFTYIQHSFLAIADEWKEKALGFMIRSYRTGHRWGDLQRGSGPISYSKRATYSQWTS
jgi:hypothetical protein